MHTSPEVLALLALGEHPADPADSQHVALCEQCRAELDSLTGLIEQGRHVPDREALDEPSEAVWAAIQSELGFIPVTRSWPTVSEPFVPATRSSSGAPPPAAMVPTAPDRPGADRSERSPRRRLLAIVLAAVLALIAGIIIGLGVDRGTDLSRFPIVDVSGEPAGDTTVAHSGNSIVRGELQQ